MKIYTIRDGEVLQFGKVVYYTLSSGERIPAVCVGQEGRGRKLGIVPVGLLPTQKEELDRNEKGGIDITDVRLATTKSGRPKLISTFNSNDTDEPRSVVVLRTRIGFRGGNEHTGDRNPQNPNEFLPFPGEVLAKGKIAQGDAGRMGSGEQLIAVVPHGITFRIKLSGRTYGEQNEWYYTVTQKGVTVATPEERQLYESGNGDEENDTP